ncbi:Protein nedd1 [Mortierella hygrophila]|uniref:Protein nedd1 n=1 Tax=Mortierella hygrophila TaxID=979708 RepID=A0A9P6EYP3_9FUNG|nr:Protein nedd1 [Mortierella hygrophila]
MDQTQLRPVAQRKRSYSTTAYSSLEEDHRSTTPSTSTLFSGTNGVSHSTTGQQAAQPTCLLATAVGTQVLTYEFIDNGAATPFSSSAGTGAPSNQQQAPIVPGQFDGIQMSNEKTTFTMASLRWSPDNSMLAVEAHDGRVFLHDDRGKFQEILANEPVVEESRAGSYRSAMSWAPKHQRLYFAHGQRIMTWDSTTSRTVETFEMPSRVNALAMKTDDALLAIGQNSGALDVVNRTTGINGRLDTPNSFILSKLEYSIFSKSIVGGIGNDGVLRLWDTGSTGSTAIYHSFEQKHDVPINGMTFSPFNRFLICTVGLDKRYTLYDVDQKSVVKTRNVDHALTSVTFKNDGFSMAFGTDQGKILLYDLRSTNRPISTVDSNVNAPITSIHFQGRRSSALRKHQTLNGSTLKRQNSAGAKPSLFSPETPLGSISTTTPMARSHTLGHTPSTLATRSTLTRPAPLKTGTGSHSSLGNVSGSSIFKSTRETQSAGLGGKGIIDLFASRHATDKDTHLTTGGQDRLTPKVRRPTAPASITTEKSAFGDTLGSFQSSAPPIAGSEGTTAAPSGFISMPTTPGRDQPQPSSASYPNSRTVSPFAFQSRQSHSPSGESSTSSCSVNTPPGSPGARGFSSEQHTNPLKHHHYSSADSLSKSPSRASRAKRRKSFGTLLASGGVASMQETLDPLSEEKMEVLRGQIVDRVRNVLLDQPTESTVVKQSRSQSGGASGSVGRSWSTSAAAVAVAPVAAPVSTKPAAASAPIRDLWMQVGLGRGSTGSNNVGGSHTSRTKGAISNNTASASTTALRLPLATLDMALDPPSETGTASSSSSFQSKVLESVIDGCLMEFRAGIRNDIQNMHLELLRQFQIQKMEIEGLLKEYTDTRELQEENQRLQEENQRLKMNY